MLLIILIIIIVSCQVYADDVKDEKKAAQKLKTVMFTTGFQYIYILLFPKPFITECD